MNAFQRFPVVLICFAIGCCISMSARAMTPTAWAPAVVHAALGQTDDAETANPRAAAATLLEQARTALDARDWQAADSLISRAEALDVHYGLLHLGDTPAKARRDYDRLVKAHGDEPQRPSVRFAPQQESVEPQTQPIQSQLDPTAPPREPVQITLDDPAGRARVFVAKGRKELERGNLAGAEHWWRQAAQQGAVLQADEDSPDKLLAAIRQAGGGANLGAPSAAPTGGMIAPPEQEPAIKFSLRQRDAERSGPSAGAGPIQSPFGRPVAIEPPIQGDQDPALKVAGSTLSTPSPGAPASGAPRDAATHLAALHAARRALAQGDFRRAAELVEQAQSSGGQFPLDGDTPARVQATLEHAQRVVARQGADAYTIEARRDRVALLIDQAKGLLIWSDVDLAEALVDAAEQIPLEYGPFDPRPGDLRKQIAAARDELSVVGGGPQVAAPTADTAPMFPDDGRDAGHQGIFDDMPTAAPVDAASADAIFAPVAAGQMSPSRPGADSLTAPGAPNESLAGPKGKAVQLLADARRALSTGDLASAEAAARAAAELRLPDSAYGPREDNPWLVMLEIDNARAANVSQGSSPVAPAGGPAAPRTSGPLTGEGAIPAEFQLPPTAPSDQAGVEAAPSDGSPFEFPSGETPLPERLPSPGEMPLNASAGASTGGKGPPSPAEAAPTADEPLSDAASPDAQASGTAGSGATLLEGAAVSQQLLARQLIDESGRAQQTADRLRESDPREGLRLLVEMRDKVAASQLESTWKDQLVRRLETKIADFEQILRDNAPLIELEERNAAVRENVEREKELKVEIQERLAVLVNDYNHLMDEQRFAEAEVLVKRAEEIAPDDMASQQLIVQMKRETSLIRQLHNDYDLRDKKAEAFLASMNSVDRSSEPINDDVPFSFGPIEEWRDLTERRRKPHERVPRTPKELEIEQKLQSDVTVAFQDTPLATAIDYLSKLTEINMHIDQNGLAEEGVTSDTPITLELGKPIMLKSVLNLILEGLNLSYIIKDEVLVITSEQLRSGQLVQVTYNVADLVIPIPNFQPNSRLGMTGLLNDAYQAQIGFMSGGGGFANSMPLAVMASNSSNTPAPGGVSPEVLAQVAGAGGGPMSQPLGFGPGGMGGGAQADFDTLIELITTTIAPTSWDEVGGSGSIQPFPTNLSLVISNTEEVHEQIVDLLDQLRRLQDLQVTIEVRFITLNDSFFERIGVDFDFDINDKIDAPLQPFGNPDPDFEPNFTNLNANTGPGRNVQDRDFGPSVVVGMAQPGIFNADLDIPFRQGSFELAVPQFGGFDPAAGASLGFAILSDLEAYFFINAATGDRRSNVLQAPKVTLFNGQQAFVADTSQSPFVISVVPVVGDFAAAQQPVIVVLSEGTYLTVQAVASPDRRFVRLTVVPFFSQIGEVNTFTFTGETSTTVFGASEGPDDATTAREEEVMTTTSGTTVQLPTFAFLSVATTVSVPDGGSVLLGGVKRLSEGRNEFGVPILNKLPYISRLFKNTAIGRETQSLMMMVTPRIIIQEEEELLLGGQSTAP